MGARGIRRGGVGLARLEVVTDAVTGVALIAVAAANQIAVASSANARVDLSGVLAAGLAACRGLRPAVEAAVQAACRSVTTPGAR